MSAPLLSLRDLSVTFRGNGSQTRAVKGLSLDIAAGETVALVGESGSGKSVSALASLGLLPDNAEQGGGVYWKGARIDRNDAAAMRRMRGNEIGMIFQEPMTSLNPLHTIEKQIGESLRQHQGMSVDAARARTLDLLNRVGIPSAETRLASYPHELSGGQRQRVMIAMALANSPDMLIADEPTTALDVTIEAQILDLLTDLKRSEDLSMLFITHDLGVVRQIADRVFVMRHGELVESGDAGGLFAAPRQAYTRDLIAAQPEGIRPPEQAQGAPLLAAHDIKVHFPIRRGLMRRTTDWIRAVDGVGLELHAGRTLGIVGESGSGKSTLARAVTKLVDHDGGVEIDGAAVTATSAGGLKNFRRDVQIVFQDPFGALSPRMSVGDIIAEGLVAHGIGTPEERSLAVADVLREVGLDPQVAGRYPHEFSGGQRQRIAIARALVLKPRVILFDEPTSALDMTVQKTLIQLLQELQARYGIGYIFISHDIALIASISHEMLVMKDGLVVEHGTAEAIMSNPQEGYTRDLITAARRKG